MKTSASISIQYDNAFAPFKGKDIDEAFKWVSTNGFDAAELIVSDPTLIDLKKILHLMETHNLQISTIATGQATVLEGISLTSPKAYEREAARKRLYHAIDFSYEIGKPNVTVGLIRGFGGNLSESMEREHLKRELTYVANYALNKEIMLNLEPINRYEVKLLNNTESVYRFILDELGDPPNVGVLYDTFHANIEDVDFDSTISDMGNKFSHVHFADSNRHLPGEGHIPFRQIIEKLEKINYQGYISLEVLNLPTAEHIRKHAKDRFTALLSAEGIHMDSNE